MHSFKKVKTYLSGGPNNRRPELSIGGPVSDLCVDDNPNVFPSIRCPDEKKYRCLYFRNDYNETLYDLCLWTESSGKTSCLVGTLQENEIQSVEVPGDFYGNFSLCYPKTIDGRDFLQSTQRIVTSGDLVKKIEEAMNNLFLLDGVTVSKSGDLILIEFSGGEKNRRQKLITCDKKFKISEVRKGSPIGGVYPKMRFDNVPPRGIMMKGCSANKPLLIGDVEPGEMFYVWFLKTVSGTVCHDTSQAVEIKTRAWTKQ